MSHAGEPSQSQSQSQSQQQVAAGSPPLHGGPTQPLFSPDVLKGLRTADKLAATWIVGLMGGIFSVGVVLYLVVFYFVNTAPQWWGLVP